MATVPLSRNSQAIAAGPINTADSCRTAFTRDLLKEHDLYRSVLFGASANVAGSATVKTGGTVSKSVRGILETPGRLSSELIAPALEAYRAYRCRSLAVCAAVGKSIKLAPGDALTVDTLLLGCQSITTPVYRQCAFAKMPDDPRTDMEQGILKTPVDMAIECKQIVTDSLTFERAALKAAFAYDAGARAGLQQAGMLDAMTRTVPTDTIAPIRQMVGLLGKLHQIPCFLAQCDMPTLKK